MFRLTRVNRAHGIGPWLCKLKHYSRKSSSCRQNAIREVEDFIDFISQRDERLLVEAATKMSQDAFREVWDNEENAAYDAYNSSCSLISRVCL